jgi:hypothetical protein
MYCDDSILDTVLGLSSAASPEHLPTTGSPQNTRSETKGEKLYNGIFCEPQGAER